MTTAGTRFRLPDPPEREPDDMTSFNHLSKNGNAYRLTDHLGQPETTIVSGEHYLVQEPGTPASERVYPDLLVAFNADPQAYTDSNSYIIAEQGKPPDFVLEIASPETADNDTGHKRRWYAGLRIPEYWRFDETGHHHGTKLAGDRLVDGQYEPISIEEPDDGVLQGYSNVLGLHVRWEHGRLEWRDPATGQPIPSLSVERLRAESEREARLQAEARTESEREARLQAEARAEQLETELRQLRES